MDAYIYLMGAFLIPWKVLPWKLPFFPWRFPCTSMGRRCYLSMKAGRSFHGSNSNGIFHGRGES